MLIRIYIVLGIIGAIIMAVWAKRNGKEPLPYVIMGALAGPLTLLLYFWFRKAIKPEQDK
jgi:hypothetical protein